MSDRILDKVSMQSVPRVRFGADLGFRGWEEVTLDRMENRALTFTGRQLCMHWNHMPTGEALCIRLWQRRKSGFALSFTTRLGDRWGTEAVAVDSLGEAMSFLEDYCAQPPGLAGTADQLIESILTLQMTVNFTQIFSALVGEALAAWSDLGPAPAKSRVTEKASA